MRCDDCLENYCKACFKRLHRKGKKARHEWRGFRINAPVCIECEVEVARKRCSHCQDMYCLPCAKTSHAKGKKKAHVMVDVREEFTDEGVGKYCHECDYREGAEMCRFCKKPTCDSCLQNAHKACAHGGLQGGRPVCVECFKPSVRECLQCRDPFCEERWTGNPGPCVPCRGAGLCVC